jgi:flagellar biosynthesis/type III secretory pathway protein FliH
MTSWFKGKLAYSSVTAVDFNRRSDGAVIKWHADNAPAQDRIEISDVNFTEYDSPAPNDDSLTDPGAAGAGAQEGARADPSAPNNLNPGLITCTEQELQIQLQSAYDQGCKDLQEMIQGDMAKLQNELLAKTEECQRLEQKTQAEIELLTSIMNDLQRDIKTDIIKLAALFAKRILQRELADNSEWLLGAVEKMLKTLNRARKITIEVSSRDVARVEEWAQRLQARAESGDAALEVLENAKITPGGYRLHNTSLAIDATIETQLSNLESLLVENIAAI